MTTQRSTIRTRPLGADGPRVCALGLGCMGMSEFYDPAEMDDAASISVIHRYLDMGGDFLDTADMYGVGRNEELIGKALAGRRERVIVATKFGNVRGPAGEFLGVRGDAAYVKSCCDASLRRLRMDHIDLYYQHRVDRQVPIEETVGAMSELVRAGKVRHLGLSEAAPATIRRAVKVHPIAALQTEYSLWSREPEDQLLPLTRELGIAFVAYSPLGRGFLSGRFRSHEHVAENDSRRNLPRFQAEHFDQNMRFVHELEVIARSKGCTAGQLAIAWVLAQGDDIIPIPGTKRAGYLDENMAAMEISLSPAELGAIHEALPPNSASGDRYHERAMKTING